MKPTMTLLISSEYLEEQRRLHADPRGYGSKGRKWADHVHAIAQRFEAEKVLDYGCGSNSLALELNSRGIKTRSYDPAVAEFSKLPKTTDMIVCTDVLEHVEPDRLEFVLSHIATLMGKVGFLVISTVETTKTLSDGRQAHISLHPRGWWLKKLAERFRKIETIDDEELEPDRQVVAIVRPKAR